MNIILLWLLLITFLITVTCDMSFIDFTQMHSVGRLSTIINDPCYQDENHFIVGVNDEPGAVLVRFHSSPGQPDWTSRLFLKSDEQFIESIVAHSHSGRQFLYVVTRKGRGLTQEKNGPLVYYVYRRQVIKIEVTEKEWIRYPKTYDFEFSDKRKMGFHGLGLLPTSDDPVLQIVYVNLNAIVLCLDTTTMKLVYPGIYRIADLPGFDANNMLVANTDGEYWYCTEAEQSKSVGIYAISKRNFTAQTHIVFASLEDQSYAQPMHLVYSSYNSSLILVMEFQSISFKPTSIFHYSVDGADLKLVAEVFDEAHTYPLSILSQKEKALTLVKRWNNAFWRTISYNIENSTLLRPNVIPSKVYFDTPQPNLAPIGNHSFAATGIDHGVPVIERIEPSSDFEAKPFLRKFNTFSDQFSCSIMQSVNGSNYMMLVGTNYGLYTHSTARIMQLSVTIDQNNALSVEVVQEFLLPQEVSSVEFCISDGDTARFISRRNDINTTVYHIHNFNIENFSLTSQAIVPIGSLIMTNFYSEKRSRIYCVSDSQLISFSIYYNGTTALPLSELKDEILGDFLSFDDNAEDVAILNGLIAGTKFSLIYIHIPSASIIDRIELAHQVDCAIKYGKRLILPVASENEECKVLELTNDPQRSTEYTIKSYIFNITQGYNSVCAFRTCFKGPSGKYAYLSADGHQVLIQVDIQKSLKFVSGVAVGTVMVNMLPDPVNNSRLFFYDSDSEGSIVFAFEVTEAVNDGLDLKYKIIFASLGAFTLIFAVLAVIIAMVSRLFKKSNKIDPLRSSLLDKLPSPSSYRLAEWEIDLDSLQFDEIIHEGPNSVIFRGCYDNMPVAIKKIKFCTDDPSKCNRLNSHLNMVRQLNHMYVLTVYGASIDDDYRYIVMDFAYKSSLDKYLDGRFTWNLRSKIRLLRQVCQAMIYLHSMNKPLVHGNLRPQNILLDNSMQVKLSDMSEITTTFNTMNGVNYMAPELIRDQTYSPSCDIFSFAMIMYQLLFECVPYHMKGERYNMYTIGSEIIQGRRPTIPFNKHTTSREIDRVKLDRWCNDVNNGYSPAIVEKYTLLMTSCWQDDEFSRPDFETAYQKISQMYDHIMDE